MSDAAISGQRGTTIKFRLEIKIGSVPVDLSLADTSLTVSVKRSRGDADPLLSKTYTAGGADDQGIALVTDDDHDKLDVEVFPAETADFTVTEFLVFDAILTEPDGTVTPVAKGAITVRAGVGS